MSYDLVLWRRKPRAKMSKGAISLCVAQNLECPALAKIDGDKIARALRREFEARELGYLVNIDRADDHLVVVTIAWSAVDNTRPVVIEVAEDERVEVFDPQQEDKPDAADRAQVAALRGHVEEDLEAERTEELVTWQREAEEGKPTAMTALGDCYAFGDRVEQNCVIAVQWYQRAAETGHLPALVSLAECYRLGQGVKRDAAKAIALYLQAFEKDRCVSAFALGQMYALGEGVARDMVKAAEFLRTARTNRHPEAFVAMKRFGIDP